MGDVNLFKDGTKAMTSRCIHVFQALAREIAPMLNNPLQPYWRRHRHRGRQRIA
jgi:hypothetical protein